MAIFFINFNDLNGEMQMTIREELSALVLMDLQDEAKQSKSEFKEFMCKKRGYALDKEHYEIELENLVMDLVDQRIKERFTSFRVDL